MSRFCPVMNPACALQRKAHASPNSSILPKRPAGFASVRAFRSSAAVLPSFFALN
jgi:hypothetical protein